jgi:hypothetical protein
LEEVDPLFTQAAVGVLSVATAGCNGDVVGAKEASVAVPVTKAASSKLLLVRSPLGLAVETIRD